MTTQEAKKILATYRPGAADAHDAEFAGALALARQDPELKQWLEENHAVQAAIRARFRQITPPVGLKQQIISQQRKSIVVVAWWRRPQMIAAAAAVVLLGSLAVFWLQREAEESRQKNFATYRTRMVGAALRSYPMSLETADGNQIRAHLAGNRAPNDYVLPAGLEKTALAGCGVLSWQEKKVAMICFLSGRPLKEDEQSDLYLFVVSRDAVGQPPQSGAPVIARVNRLTTASWSAGDKTYILATPGDEEFIRRFL